MVQVGMGSWGRDWARRAVPQVAEVDLVGIVDSDPRALALAREEVGLEKSRCFNSFDAALDATRPDAVLITTTLDGHAPIARAALEAGLHVLVEKPFTDTLDCARELVELAAAKARTLMVSQNYRFFPAPRVVARLVQENSGEDGSLGELYAISIDFRRNDPAPPKPRRRHHDDVHPLLLDMSIHHFDLLRFVIGAEPTAVACETSHPVWTGFAGPPVAVASIKFGEILVSYSGSWISAGPETAWAGEWRMEFERGQLFWTSRGEDPILLDRVTLRPRRGRARALPLPTMPHIDRAGTLAEFASALNSNREPETSGRDNVGTIALTTAAIEASERRHWVPVAR